jgi:hypothetical protein
MIPWFQYVGWRSRDADVGRADPEASFIFESTTRALIVEERRNRYLQFFRLLSTATDP